MNLVGKCNKIVIIMNFYRTQYDYFQYLFRMFSDQILQFKRIKCTTPCACETPGESVFVFYRAFDPALNTTAAELHNAALIYKYINTTTAVALE